MTIIDVFVYKVESFDSECFEQEITSYSVNTLFLTFNKKGIYFVHTPPNFKKKNLLFFRFFNSPKLDYGLYPLSFLIDHFRIFLLFLSICSRCRVKVIIVENPYVGVIAGAMRKCQLVKKMIYLPGDWLAGSKTKVVSRSYIGNNIIFPIFDYLTCRWSDKTLDCTQAITEARNKFWGKSISKKELVFQGMLKIKAKARDLNYRNKKIIFLGTVREDSGIGIVIRALASLRKYLDVSLKIIGHDNGKYGTLMNLAQKFQVENHIELIGFVERNYFEQALSDCFCGVNLIETSGSYTSYTIPAKVMDYLQYLLPVIVTKNIGIMAEVIQNNRLGLVIEPKEDSFVEAVVKVYEKRTQYQKNVVAFINSHPKADFKTLLDC